MGVGSCRGRSSGCVALSSCRHSVGGSASSAWLTARAASLLAAAAGSGAAGASCRREAPWLSLEACKA